LRKRLKIPDVFTPDIGVGMDSHVRLGDTARHRPWPASLMIENLTCSHFEPHVGDAFMIVTEGTKVALVLKEAKPLGTALREGGAFSLSFVGPTAPLLPQAIYPLGHDALGTLELFIVPVGRGKDGAVYEAIFT
jgi:hypothetical protein